jgi:hypothetical protein
MPNSLIVNIDPVIQRDAQYGAQYDLLLQDLRRITAENASPEDVQEAQSIIKIIEENNALPAPSPSEQVHTLAAMQDIQNAVLTRALKVLSENGVRSVEIRQGGKRQALLLTDCSDTNTIATWAPAASAHVEEAASRWLLQDSTVKKQVLTVFNLSLALYNAFETGSDIVVPKGLTVIKTFDAEVSPSGQPLLRELMAVLCRGSGNELWLAFRGADGVHDLRKLLEREPKEFKPRGFTPEEPIYLPKGCVDIYCSMREEILKTVRDLSGKYRLCVGGHSLGSILSSCFLFDIPPDTDVSVYTAAPLKGASPSCVKAYLECTSLRPRTLRSSLGILNTADAIADYPWSGGRLPLTSNITFGTPFALRANHKLANYIECVKHIPLRHNMLVRAVLALCDAIKTAFCWFWDKLGPSSEATAGAPVITERVVNEHASEEVTQLTEVEVRQVNPEPKEDKQLRV